MPSNMSETPVKLPRREIDPSPPRQLPDLLIRLLPALFVLCVGIIPFLTFVGKLPFFQAPLPRLGLGGIMAVAGGLVLRLWYQQKNAGSAASIWLCLSVAVMLSSSLYVAFSYVPEVSNNPFTLTWSEASRYYYASLFFAERIYGQAVPPTVLHPSRYLLQAVPFLIPDAPIWVHRLWQVVLWILLPLLTAFVFARRLGIQTHLHRLLFISSVFLYLMTGPVYYHLLVPGILVLWGFRTQTGDSWKRQRLLSFLVVFAAAVWAGISRINWFPVPGSLAAILILLEEPVRLNQAGQGSPNGFATLRYLLRLAGWMLFGALTAFGSQLLYIYWSGNEAEQFTTSFSSSLLWHRLLPSETYPLGILPAILLVSLPFAVVIFGRLVQLQGGAPAWKKYHPIRLLGMAGLLLIFFLGGILVSVKIGGGSNIHNMDAYMVMLLVIGMYFLFEKVQPDHMPQLMNPHLTLPEKVDENVSASSPIGIRIGLALAVLIFPAFTVPGRQPIEISPAPGDIANGLATVSEAVQSVVQRGGQVLFISNRQLLTFHHVNAPLIPDYERVFLMEVAMANDQTYLARFRDDLKNHRFDLIISEPISLSQKEGAAHFAAENNAWVKNVSRYLLCYYEPAKTLRKVQVQLLAPAADGSVNCR